VGPTNLAVCRRPRDLVLSQITLFKGDPRHHHFDGSDFVAVARNSLGDAPGSPSTSALRHLTYRAWLLHLLHIHPVGWRGIQPPYCFHGATATRRSRSASLGLITGSCIRLPRPTILYLRTGIRNCDPHTHALLLPSFPNLLAQGAEKPSLSSSTHPFSSAGCPTKYSGGVNYSPRQGSETTTRPC